MSARTCPTCGAVAAANQNFCGTCGAALPPPSPPPADAGWAQPQPATTWVQPDQFSAGGVAEPPGYDPWMTVLAVLLTIFAPFIGLIVALVLRSSETNPVKRAFLKTWAWISGGIVIAYTVLFLIFAAAVFNAAGGVSTIVRLP